MTEPMEKILWHRWVWKHWESDNGWRTVFALIQLHDGFEGKIGARAHITKNYLRVPMLGLVNGYVWNADDISALNVSLEYRHDYCDEMEMENEDCCMCWGNQCNEGCIYIMDGGVIRGHSLHRDI